MGLFEDCINYPSILSLMLKSKFIYLLIGIQFPDLMSMEWGEKKSPYIKNSTSKSYGSYPPKCEINFGRL